jgi:hypothetical protein
LPKRVLVRAAQRIGKGIDNFNRKQHGTGSESRNFENIRVEKHQKSGNIGPVEIEPHIGQAITDLLTPR